jgi:hypothetical protein
VSQITQNNDNLHFNLFRFSCCQESLNSKNTFKSTNNRKIYVEDSIKICEWKIFIIDLMNWISRPVFKGRAVLWTDLNWFWFIDWGVFVDCGVFYGDIWCGFPRPTFMADPFKFGKISRNQKVRNVKFWPSEMKK